MRTKSTLPEGYRYQKSHTVKWAVFYGLNELVGFVRKVGVSGSWSKASQTGGYYYRFAEPNWVGPYPSKDEAAKALIKEWEL